MGIKLLFAALSTFILISFISAKAAVEPESTPLLNNSPDLRLERSLLKQHYSNVEFTKKNYEQMVVYKQPVNKSEPCKISSEIFDNRISQDDGAFVLWEGACNQGMADGFGRLYLIRSATPILELLAKLDADSLENSTVYYFKDTTVQGQTIFFYGKSNRHKASGITITQRDLDNNFIVAMLSLDKDNLLTYKKETSLNSKYVLNSMGLTNYSHIIYDLRNSSYNSLDLSYKMVDADSMPIGFSLIGMNDGQLSAEMIRANTQRPVDIEPTVDMVKRIMEIVGDIDSQIEESLKNVLEAQPVVEVYKQVVCTAEYNSTLCHKLNCKSICSTKETISPNDSRVKELLLYLVHQHNAQEMRNYLRRALAERKNQENKAAENNLQSKQRTDILRQ